MIEFNGSFSDSYEPEFQEFNQKFRLKLKYLGFAESLLDFDLFPNVECFEENSVTETFFVHEVLQMNSNNLKTLMISIDLNEEYLLPLLLEKFDKLTHLILELKN